MGGAADLVGVGCGPETDRAGVVMRFVGRGVVESRVDLRAAVVDFLTGLSSSFFGAFSFAGVFGGAGVGIDAGMGTSSATEVESCEDWKSSPPTWYMSSSSSRFSSS